MLQRVIHKGAVRLVIPGNFPIGLYANLSDRIWDQQFQCIRWTSLKKLNNFSEYHNKNLQRAIKELRRQNPSVKIAYGDNYHSFYWLFHNARSLGKSRYIVKERNTNLLSHRSTSNNFFYLILFYCLKDLILSYDKKHVAVPEVTTTLIWQGCAALPKFQFAQTLINIWVGMEFI